MTCPLCAGKLRVQPTVRLNEGAIHTCLGCGSGILWPRPDQAALSALHDNTEYFHHPYFAAHRTTADDSIPIFEDRLRRLRPLLRGPSSDLVVLDVGCDTGGFMAFLSRRAGVKTIGVDVSSAAVEAGRAEGRDVRLGTLESQGFAEASFDVVTAFDVLEHVAHPFESVAEVRRVLKPNGVLVAEMPNYDGLVYRLGRLLGELQGFVGPLNAARDRLWPGFHVQYPTKAAIAGLLQRAGFGHVRIDGRELTASELVFDCPGLRLVVLLILKIGCWLGMPTILVVTARCEPTSHP